MWPWSAPRESVAHIFDHNGALLLVLPEGAWKALDRGTLDLSQMRDVDPGVVSASRSHMLLYVTYRKSGSRAVPWVTRGEVPVFRSVRADV